jgi:hypothetical protein
MQVWTCYIISMPSGGLVANHNRNQCITSTLGWRKFTVNTLHGGLHWSPPNWPLRACTASSPGPTKNWPLPCSAEDDTRGGALGQLLFVTAEPHSFGGGGGQHRGRQTGTWLRVSSLRNLPLESRAIPATETRLRRRWGRRKPEKGIEGGRQGRTFIKKVRMRKWCDG